MESFESVAEFQDCLSTSTNDDDKRIYAHPNKTIKIHSQLPYRSLSSSHPHTSTENTVSLERKESVSHMQTMWTWRFSNNLRLWIVIVKKEPDRELDEGVYAESVAATLR